MFERFTASARQVVVLAQDEARGLKQGYIGTEHLLLGLLREEEGLAARVLDALDVTAEAVRTQVIVIVGMGDITPTGQIPFTPRAKKVLELALREALSLGHNYIGSEHVLLGLARENEGVAARILLSCGADAESIRNEIIRMLSGLSRPRSGSSAGPGNAPTTSVEYEVVDWADADPAARKVELDRLGEHGWALAAVVPRDEGSQWIFQRVRRHPPRLPIIASPAAPADESAAPVSTGRMLAEIEALLDKALTHANAADDPARAVEVTELARRLETLTERSVSAATPDLPAGEVVDRVRRDKEQLIEARDFEGASRLRDLERAWLALLRDIDAAVETAT